MPRHVDASRGAPLIICSFFFVLYFYLLYAPCVFVIAFPVRNSSVGGRGVHCDRVIRNSGWSYIGAWVNLGDRDSLGGVDREM